MIVRISGEGQYALDDGERDPLNELERKVAATLDGRSEEFPGAYAALLEHVRSNGRRVPDDELESSDVILPPADTTYDEARSDFTGEGLIPD